ncbi:hypothetical protein [Chitinophaga vietnamensis]|uniref:hypothetical protein n=1 Tax=Chitinophaga vietnamensis TaxID=2593957 RepID=UPI0011777B28|nr:hypothetical protein [Chitinophaga vietnamensis]
MKTLQRTTLFTTLLLLLTSIHHLYGAIIYHSHWRLHILFISLPLLFIIWLLDKRYRATHSNSLRLTYLLAVGIFPMIVIGVYEGVYNHLFKNIIYFAGVDDHIYHMLFPAPLYEKPNDWLFELTGILQAFFVYPLLVNFMKMCRRTIFVQQSQEL